MKRCEPIQNTVKASNNLNTGVFIGVGVGPGNPELITLKATRTIGEADILLVPKAASEMDSLALQIAKPYVKENSRIEARTFPMVKDLEKKIAAWEAISEEVRQWVKAGLKVVFLTLGDTMTYATFVYLLERLKDDIAIEIVPGITSYQGIASETGQPLVMDDMTMTVVPCNLPLETIRAYVRREDALVLMKLSLQFRPLVEMLIEEGVVPYAKLVSHATQERQVIYNDITQIEDEKVSYFSTMIINKRWE